jgi:hypothetical protein
MQPTYFKFDEAAAQTKALKHASVRHTSHLTKSRRTGALAGACYIHPDTTKPARASAEVAEHLQVELPD